MAREKKQMEGPPPPAAWMATFSDLMNLLLCFFVLLFSLSSVDAEKFAELAASFSSSFSIFPAGATAIGDGLLISNGVSQLNELSEYFSTMGLTDDGDGEQMDIDSIKAAIEREKLEKSETMAEEIEAALLNYDMDGIDVDFTSQYVQLQMNGALLFDSGKAVLKDDAKSLLDKIGDILVQYPDSLIEVIGHTDNVPISTGKYRDNMDLSYYRARAVMDYLLENEEIPRELMQTSGRGEEAPIASNETAEGRALNRRVEIRIHREVE